MNNVAILGSTGTIGRNTLDVVRRSREPFRVSALAAGSNMRLSTSRSANSGRASSRSAKKEDAGALSAQARTAIGSESSSGPEGAGGIGRRPGQRHRRLGHHRDQRADGRPWPPSGPGKRVALANKESMVVAGPLLARGSPSVRRPDHPRRFRAQRRLPVPGRAEDRRT